MLKTGYNITRYSIIINIIIIKTAEYRNVLQKDTVSLK